MSRNKDFKYFTLCVINLYNIYFTFHFLKRVTKNIDLFHDIHIFLDVPVWEHHIGLEWNEGEFSFWVNYPFKSCSAYYKAI